MSGALAIFVKTPGLSPVKTRLARVIGANRAEAFHLAAAEATASVAVQLQSVAAASVYWAVAEPAAMFDDTWVDLPRIAQGKGELGERLDRVYRQLLSRHRYALLLGADAPQLDLARLRQAVSWLATGRPRLVIGPARDGGFWLFGGNVPLPTLAWHAARLGTCHAAADLRVLLAGQGEWRCLDCLDDVDRADDLPRAQAALRELAQPTEAQRRLLCWLDELPVVAGGTG